MVLWIAAWFALVLPAHERGQFRTDEAQCQTTRSCCSTKSQGKNDTTSPRKDPTRCCAVCAMVFKLSAPTAVPVFALHFELIGVYAQWAVDQAVVEVSSPHDCRGPPSMA